MNIVLIGFMGTGKSEVGRVVAKRLGWDFIDTDEMIEKETGAKVADIFSRGGEASFRELEAKAVSLVSILDKTVIATGGGAPLNEDNMKQLALKGRVFCLTARPETILQRLRDQISTRPLLKGKDPARAVEELLRARHGAYARCHHSVSTDGLTLQQVADKVLAQIPAEAR